MGASMPPTDTTEHEHCWHLFALNLTPPDAQQYCCHCGHVRTLPPPPPQPLERGWHGEYWRGV
jgi:hypothetical protein